jgi:large subunit ribosomal protein L4
VNIDVKSVTGAVVGSTELPEAFFGIEPNVPVMHQVVTAQLAGIRAGTQSTKTRSEVSGGGAKPWKQKGTGRARAGSNRSPLWRGGGVALGPKPRKYNQRTPKKMIRLALLSALSDRAANNNVVVVDNWGFETPKTKQAIEALTALQLANTGERQQRILLVVDYTEEATWLSFRNLGTYVQLILPRELNTYDVLNNDWLVFSQGTLDQTIARLSGNVDEIEISVAVEGDE